MPHAVLSLMNHIGNLLLNTGLVPCVRHSTAAAPPCMVSVSFRILLQKTLFKVFDEWGKTEAKETLSCFPVQAARLHL